MLPIRPFKVVKRESPAEDLCRLVLEPADNEPVFPFEAGQFVMVREPNEDGATTHPRAFSLASAPCESQRQIEFGIRAQGSFSHALCACQPGAIYNIQGPFGTFTLNKTAKRLIFFAGGVGMTPFRSHIRESLLTGLGQELVLFYSGQNQNDLMYHDEFMELSKKYPNFKYIPIVTRECPNGWPGECHRFNEEMLDKYVGDFSTGEFMMCGPVALMDNVRQLLQSRGVDTEKRLRFERY
ncbi:MAG: ferredoxin--NADP reductase [Patescibacteria group bacterium]